MAANNCDGEGKPGEEDMATPDFWVGVTAIGERQGEEESTTVAIIAGQRRTRCRISRVRMS